MLSLFNAQFMTDAAQTENWLDQQLTKLDSQFVRSDVTSEEARTILSQLEVRLILALLF